MFGKALNKLITGNDFVDMDTDKYIYASLTQPPIKILDKNGSDDELDFTVECPNCKRAVIYGDEIYMIHGHIYCSDKKCRKEVYEKVGETYYE